MKRIETLVRSDWQKTVESQGMYYHTIDDKPYWDESVYYLFDAKQIDQIEKCTYKLNEMCLEAVQYVITNGLLGDVGIPFEFEKLIEHSWDHDEHTLYGRFDLWYDGVSEPKLFEYNADTPTALLEAAVIQWYWMQDKFPNRSQFDQFNSIHEKLIDAWKIWKYDQCHFAALKGNLEDYMTVNYLRDTAIQAGVETKYLDVEDIGWSEEDSEWMDKEGKQIEKCFKLYPWEWMFKDKFGMNLNIGSCEWMEAPWKSVLSNKAILCILYELFPDSPYLLTSRWEDLAMVDYVIKPIHGREGSNVTIVKNNNVLVKNDGPYEGKCIYQEYKELPNFNGFHPVIGSWMINGWAAGIGIREDSNLITGNTSRFVPHVFKR